MCFSIFVIVIYNSRNSIGLKNTQLFLNWLISTIVEIQLVLKTLILTAPQFRSTIVEIQLVLKTHILVRGHKRSTIVEIQLVLKTVNSIISLDDLQ